MKVKIEFEADAGIAGKFSDKCAELRADSGVVLFGLMANWLQQLSKGPVSTNPPKIEADKKKNIPVVPSSDKSDK